MNRGYTFAAIFFLAALRFLGHGFTPLSVEELTRKAVLIVHGQIVAKICQKDDSGRIFTEVELQPKDVWKGSVAENEPVRIVYSGGVLGNAKTIANPEVDYDLAEEVVAFLRRNENGQAVTIGLIQGKFEVFHLKDSAQQWVRNPFLGAFSSDPPDPRSLLGNGLSSGPLSLSELRRRVHGRETR